VTYYVLFFIHLESRKVRVAGITVRASPELPIVKACVFFVVGPPGLTFDGTNGPQP
jgi:hypothetical protein